MTDTERAAQLLRTLAAELRTKAPKNATCATLAKQGESAADALEVQAQPPVRFFARIEGATLECPRCGTVHRFGAGFGSAQARIWDPVTARLRCVGCGIRVTLAVVAWTRVRWDGAGAGQPPKDQVPNDRERAALRGLARGIWHPERLPGKAGASNVRMPEWCTCTPGAIGAETGCLVHPYKGPK